MAQTLPGRSLCAPGKVRLLEFLHIPFTHPHPNTKILLLLIYASEHHTDHL